MKINPNSQGQRVNKKQLAEIFGISERSFTEYQKDPQFPILKDGERGEKNTYDTAQVFRYLMSVSESKSANEQSSLAKAKTEQAEADAALKRLNYHEKLGTLILKEDAQDLLKKWAVKAIQEYKDGFDGFVEDLQDQLEIEVPEELIETYVTSTNKRVGRAAVELAGGDS